MRKCSSYFPYEVSLCLFHFIPLLGMVGTSHLFQLIIAWKNYAHFIISISNHQAGPSIPLITLNSFSKANIFIVLTYRADFGILGSFSSTLHGEGQWLPGLIFRFLCICSPNNRQIGYSYAGPFPQSTALIHSFYGMSLGYFGIKPVTLSAFICPFVFLPFGKGFGCVFLASAEV